MIVPTEILKQLVAINHPALKDHAFTRVEVIGKPAKQFQRDFPATSEVGRVIHVTVGDLVRDLIEARE